MQTTIKTHSLGVMSDGSEPSLFMLDNGSMRVGLLDYGATIVSALVPAGQGQWLDLLLGFSDLAAYTGNHPYFGSTVGRFANRIAGARFTLDGTEYRTGANDGDHTLHGGHRGFDKQLWKAEAGTDAGNPAVRMELCSPDGDQGFPGRLDVKAFFSLSQDNTLAIRYEARTQAATPLSISNHAYFNLKSEGKGTILDHELEIASSRYLPVGNDLIPLSQAPSALMDTPFDFRAKKPMGRDIAAAGGYDHCYALDAWDGTTMVRAASVLEPDSGRTLSVYTDMPALQFYSGNFLANISGKRGSVYKQHAGFCLEAEYYPDSPNRPDFPDCTLRPGRKYCHSIEYRFGF